jgi:hypothetical protein
LAAHTTRRRACGVAARALEDLDGEFARAGSDAIHWAPAAPHSRLPIHPSSECLTSGASVHQLHLAMKRTRKSAASSCAGSNHVLIFDLATAFALPRSRTMAQLPSGFACYASAQPRVVVSHLPTRIFVLSCRKENRLCTQARLRSRAFPSIQSRAMQSRVYPKRFSAMIRRNASPYGIS